MKNEKMYLIAEDTYHQHIDQEVHLYGLLHQLAFQAGKVKEPGDAEHLIDTAIRYGQIADELFENWNIPGRYLVHGDKADLSTLKEKELVEVVAEPEDEPGHYSLREALEEYLSELMDTMEILAAAIGELDALGTE